MSDTTGGSRCASCGTHATEARLYAAGGVALCTRCYDQAAPFGYTTCNRCRYEKAIGLPCGEPCV